MPVKRYQIWCGSNRETYQMRREESANLVRAYGSQFLPLMVTDFGVRVEDETIAALGDRMMVAAAKYEVEPDLQSFEMSSVDVMLIGLREELLDVVNYCAMTDHLAQKSGEGYMGEVRYRLRRLADNVMADLISIEMHRQNQPEAKPVKDYLALLGEQTGRSHE
jgi:hypothetical protein